MRQSLRQALIPRTAAQWMAVLGLVPFAAGAWIQARNQREIRIATVAVEQQLGDLERRLTELKDQVGTAGVKVAVTDEPVGGSDSVPGRAGAVRYDSLHDGTRALHAENATLAHEFDRLTRVREDLVARRGALRGTSAPANILLAIGALVTMAGVLTDIRQFRQQRRRAG